MEMSVPMSDIINLAKEYKLIVIEDCAESIFSKYKNKYCGTFGEIGCFSLQATKTITTGEGGFVITDNTDLSKKMFLYRSHGLRERGRYFHELMGHNFRLTNIQAALGLAQLEKINEIISQRRRVHRKYKELLLNEESVKLQEFTEDVEPVLWAFAIKLNENAYPQGRDKIIELLKEKNIESRPGFIAPSQIKIYNVASLPICEEISNNVISLPTFPTIKDEQIEYICKQLLKMKR